MSILPGQKSKCGNLRFSVTIPGKYGLCHYSSHLHFCVKHFRADWWLRQEHTWQPWCCQWNMEDLAYCANWVISEDLFFPPFVPSLFDWFYNHASESRSLESSSASFCLAIDRPWACPWVTHLSLRLGFFHLTIGNIGLAVSVTFWSVTKSFDWTEHAFHIYFPY